jgi:hypothetical protein
MLRFNLPSLTVLSFLAGDKRRRDAEGGCVRVPGYCFGSVLTLSEMRRKDGEREHQNGELKFTHVVKPSMARDGGATYPEACGKPLDLS